MILPGTVLTPEQRRRLAIGWILEGQKPAEVADLLRVSERSVWRWLSAWRRGGEEELATHPGRGRPSKLRPAQTQQVLRWLEASPCDLGFASERWTAPRLAALIQQRWGVRMNHRYLNDWLARHGITPQVPQRRPRERDEAVIRGWIEHQWPRIKKR